MKALLLLAFVVYSASAGKLLGGTECTWGPSYWCSNITAAAGCRAVKHCIQTVWEHKVVEDDTDSICQICKDMVQQARDQLNSNETQEEIQEVFEGSCNLIPVKVVRKECCRLADDFVIELVDTLSSQMNPQVVCAVAGFCNSARVDDLLAEYEKEQLSLGYVEENSKVATAQDTCTGCHTVVDILEKNFLAMSRDQFMRKLLQICGHMSSLSDACSNIILNNFEEIYSQMLKYFNSNSVCLLSGECSAQFHVHNVEITPMSKTGIVPISNKDDIPCDLCKQLVGHLRDLLIANTTELEFQKVLVGLCKQTKEKFQKQCLSLVDEYYTVIYSFLISQLDSNAVCGLIGICPNGTLLRNNADFLPIVPLLPLETIETVESQHGVLEFQKPELMQLPIERILPHTNVMFSKQLCTFCEYFLHYLQIAITSPATEQEVKDVIDKVCQQLPSVVNNTCVEFVNTYGDAVFALMAQSIDPASICPLIRACPSSDMHTVEIFMQEDETNEKPKCSLCLFSVTQLEEMVKSKKTVGNIKTALNSLCSHLSGNIAAECQDFVNTYTDELVDMMVADFTPQEVCVFLQLCVDKMPAETLPPHVDYESKILTNEIPDNTVNGLEITDLSFGKVKANPQCILCELVMTKIDKALENKTTQAQIEKVVHSVCHALPKTIRKECDDFVDKYADTVIILLVSALKPDEICTMMKLCDAKKKFEATIAVPNSVHNPQCVLCKYILQQIESIAPSMSEKDLIDDLSQVCLIVPNSEAQNCRDFIATYGHNIYELLILATAPDEICSLLLICGEAPLKKMQNEVNYCGVCHASVLSVNAILTQTDSSFDRKHVMRKGCYSLPTEHVVKCMKILNSYSEEIYESLNRFEDSAEICRNIHLCNGLEFVGRVRRSTQLVGGNKCTWGPSYWCESSSQATKCGDGAVKHCQTKVWMKDSP